MYRRLEDDPISGYPILTWDVDLNVENSRLYVVVETTSILKVLHIIPPFRKEGQYFINKFKF
jgi:hypothetical protein